jgi:hypothetical protein
MFPYLARFSAELVVLAVKAEEVRVPTGPGLATHSGVSMRGEARREGRRKRNWADRHRGKWEREEGGHTNSPIRVE